VAIEAGNARPHPEHAGDAPGASPTVDTIAPHDGHGKFRVPTRPL
jgi:hypothetical protein